MSSPLPVASLERPVRAAVVQALLALLAAVCGLAFAPAFGSALTAGDLAPARLLITVLVCAAVPPLVVAVARRYRAPAVAAAAAGVVATVVAVAVGARPGTAVFAGPYRLLTSALPADPTGPACAAVGGLTGFAALAAALLAAYSRHHALAVAPPLACLFAALALDAGTAPPPAWYAAAVLVPLGAALAAIRQPVRASGGAVATGTLARVARAGFPLAGAGAILAAGAVLATALAPNLPAVDRTAADARDLVPPPLLPRSAVVPMLEYPALAHGDEKAEFAGTSSRRVPRLSAVTLPDFNGRYWTSDARFRRAGTTLRTAPAGLQVSLDVRVADAGPLPWLPRPDRPSTLDADDLGIDESTGDLVVPGGVAYPSRYRVTGSLPTLPDTARGDRPVRRTGAVSTGTSEVPRQVTDFARRARTARGDTTLLGLQNLLRVDDFYVDDSADPPGGSGYFQILKLLTARGRHLGTSEQYASAFAVMARVLGYQSRVVLGYVPRYKGTGNTFAISGRDVQAWPQVQFARSGWVTYDPTPSRQASQAPRQRNPAGAQGSPSPSSSSPNTAPPTPPATTPSRVDADRDRAGGTSTLTLVLLLVAVVVVLLVLTPPSVKAGRRRRRRGAAVPAHAVYGAWRETTDRLTEVGRPPQRGTLTSTVADGAPRPARDDVRALGRLLDRAGYAPEAATRDDATSAWRHADDARGRIRETLPWWRRLLAALDPRPLWRR